MNKHIVCIASEYKGVEFLEEARNAGWDVTLVTRENLRDADWPWMAINDVKTVAADAQPLDYVRAITNIAGSMQIHRIVGLDEFDVLTAAVAREHLNLPGMSDGSVTIVDMKSEKVVGSMDTLKKTGFNPNSMVLLPKWNDLAGH